MRDDTKLEIMKRLVSRIRADSTDMFDEPLLVDVEEFIDDDRAALERSSIFLRYPIVVAVSSELAVPNDFITRAFYGIPLLLTRSPAGEILAFRNACRHRGSRIEWEESGNRRVFSCRYHGWSYNGDGSLRNVTDKDGFAGIDPRTCGLTRVGAAERHGLVFVTLGGDGEDIDLAAHFGPEFDEELGSFGLESHRLERAAEFREPMNWKVALHGLLDNYHLKYLHGRSVSPRFYTNLAIFDAFGANSRLVVPRRAIDDMLDDDPAAIDLDHTIINYSLFPNTAIVRQPHHFEVWTVLPDVIEAGRCVIELRFLVGPGEPDERSQRRWDKSWDILMSAIQPEDLVVGRSIQEGFACGGAGPAIIGRNEVSIQHAHRKIDEACARVDIRRHA